MTTFNPQQKLLVRRIECENSGLYFARYFFKQRYKAKMLVSAHHHLLQAALDRTLLSPFDLQYISRLIINVPPGYTKTELAVINYIARGLALNAQARFMHLSSSEALALENSSTARNIIKSPEYQAMWPLTTRDDADSKSIWWTHEGGGVRAAPTAGQIVGFRAGHMVTSSDCPFTGAMVIDDPIKPDDTHFITRIEEINNRYTETVASRLAVEQIPVIVIMQRLDYNDLSGFLLRGGSQEKWHHLNLPVLIEPDKPYPEENTHGIPLHVDLPKGWLWPVKHNGKHHVALKANRRRYLAQYLQKPPKRDEANTLWTEELVNTARNLVHQAPQRQTVVSIDPAVSNNKRSDLHGIGVATKHSAKSFSVLADHSLRGTPEQWAAKAIQLYSLYRADAIVIEINQGGDMCESTLRNAGFLGRIQRVRATKGKVLRAEPIVALYELKMVAHAPNLAELEEEMLDLNPLTGLANTKSPNRVDWLVWALTYLSEGVDFRTLMEMCLGNTVDANRS